MEFLGGEEGPHSAVLIFTTSEGDVSFDLSATAVPRPVTLALAGLALSSLGAYLRRRRR